MSDEDVETLRQVQSDLICGFCPQEDLAKAVIILIQQLLDEKR